MGKSSRYNNLSVIVIDDLADRSHKADVLLDQNLGRTHADYDKLLNKSCQRFIGPRYALLRPQFHSHRTASLERRHHAQLESLLISMGGSDEHNATAKLLNALAAHPEILEGLQAIHVVLGSQSRRLQEVKALLSTFPKATTELHIDLKDMAAIMSIADLAIGAGGTTSWERCCLGLPSVIFSLAQNQIDIAKHLHERGAAIYLGQLESARWADAFISALVNIQADASLLRVMSEQACTVTDGLGAARFCREALGIEV